jgi:ADP-ribose pyrophosphatase YjhB (NUDIX family)
MIIRNSARAVIIVDNKLLVTRMNNKGIFYLLPGGGQNPGEIITETLERECEEELQYKVKVNELLFVRESFDDKETQRVELIFHCTLLGKVENCLPVFDTMQCGIDWLNIDELSSLPLYPEEIRYQIQQFYDRKQIKTYYGIKDIQFR